MIYVALCTLCFCSLWLKDIRYFVGSFTFFIVIGLAINTITPIACLWLAATAALFYLYIKNTQYRLAFWVGLLLAGLAYGLHIVPGFNNLNHIDEFQLSQHAGSFAVWFNFDKLAFGLLGTAFILHKELIRGAEVARLAIRECAALVIFGIVSIYAVAVLIGYSDFDVSFNRVFWPWALKNLVFTVLAEELLFRGLLQRELSLRLPDQGYLSHIPIITAAALFGIAHFAGGPEYITLSFLAGLVYGYAYKITGRIESAIAAHFVLNAVHFVFFAYPYSI